jgi:large subunit ribosomal protein LP2
LAALGGNASPSEADVKKILSSVGVDVDAASLKKVVDELKGKNIEELMDAGRKKLATMPAGGAAPAAAAGGAAPAAAGGDKKAEKPKEKEPEPESDEGDDDMGFGLFD